MQSFRLIGRTGPVFNVASLFTIGEGSTAIQCVHGVTVDGKQETRARIADVVDSAIPAEAVAEILIERDLLERARFEVLALKAAGHGAKSRRTAQGVEIEITRKGWHGVERSYSILTPRRAA